MRPKAYTSQINLQHFIPRYCSVSSESDYSLLSRVSGGRVLGVKIINVMWQLGFIRGGLEKTAQIFIHHINAAV